MGMTAFFNRYDAGRQLGVAMLAAPPADPVIIGLSRGGVPVAAEVARILDAPLDVCLVRKVMHDGMTIGAVSEGAIYLDHALIATLGISASEIETTVLHELGEIARSAELLRDGPPISLAGKDAILVDDGVVTGATLHAAIRALRLRDPRTLTLAVPVASTSALAALRSELDDVVCLEVEPFATAIGARYQQFLPVSEAEVLATLLAVQRETSGLRPAQEHALGL